MSASRCRLDPASEVCADCRFLGDCLDEAAFFIPAPVTEPRTDAPLKSHYRTRAVRRERLLRRYQ